MSSVVRGADPEDSFSFLRASASDVLPKEAMEHDIDAFASSRCFLRAIFARAIDRLTEC